MTFHRSGRALAAVLGVGAAALLLPAALLAIPIEPQVTTEQVEFAGEEVDGLRCEKLLDLLEFDAAWDCGGTTVQVRELPVEPEQSELALRRTMRLSLGGGPLPDAPLLPLSEGSLLPHPHYHLIGVQVGDHYAVVAGPDSAEVAVDLWQTATGKELPGVTTRELEAL